jgi:hypothetical protein
MARPTQYPRQLVMQVTDELADRVTQDASLRGDGSKSAAARRLLELGTILADALEQHGTIDPVDNPDNVLDDLLDAAQAVR